MTGKKLHLSCFFSSCLRYSTHTDIKIVVKCCCDVHIYVYRSFSGPRNRENVALQIGETPSLWITRLAAATLDMWMPPL